MRTREHCAELVKGVTRRVIVVREPGSELFEEARFIVRENALRRGVSSEQVLREARRAAGRYMRERSAERSGWKLGIAVTAALAALAAAVVLFAGV